MILDGPCSVGSRFEASLKSIPSGQAITGKDGMLATLAMLYGAGAEAFLDGEGVRYWCRR